MRYGSLVLLTALAALSCSGSGDVLGEDVGVVRGTVTQPGGELAGDVFVRIGELRTRSGKDGSYSVEDVPAGLHEVASGSFCDQTHYRGTVYVFGPVATHDIRLEYSLDTSVLVDLGAVCP